MANSFEPQEVSLGRLKPIDNMHLLKLELCSFHSVYSVENVWKVWQVSANNMWRNLNQLISCVINDISHSFLRVLLVVKSQLVWLLWVYALSLCYKHEYCSFHEICDQSRFTRPLPYNHSPPTGLLPHDDSKFVGWSALVIVGPRSLNSIKIPHLCFQWWGYNFKLKWNCFQHQLCFTETYWMYPELTYLCRVSIMGENINGVSLITACLLTNSCIITRRQFLISAWCILFIVDLLLWEG